MCNKQNYSFKKVYIITLIVDLNYISYVIYYSYSVMR